jgi:hypothetical protein
MGPPVVGATVAVGGSTVGVPGVAALVLLQSASQRQQLASSLRVTVSQVVSNASHRLEQACRRLATG